MKQSNTDSSVAIITGANSGIGEAIAHRLAYEGWQLVLCGRRSEENERVAHAIRQKYESNPRICQLDVSIEADCLRLVNEAVETEGRVDLLVNNAGIGAGGKIADSDTATFERILRTNLYGTYWCSREVYKVMRGQPVTAGKGLRGSIINISSVCGIDAWAGSGIYCASKHGVMALTRAMSDEGKEDFIRVTSVCPALVATPMSNVTGPEYIQPEDVAGTVSYLLGLSAAVWPTEMVLPRRGAS